MSRPGRGGLFMHRISFYSVPVLLIDPWVPESWRGGTCDGVVAAVGGDLLYRTIS